VEDGSLPKAIGCAAVIPAFLIGFAGLNDGIGPTGWRGFGEVFGWVAVCVSGSWIFARLITRSEPPRRWHYCVVLLLAAGFTYLPYWLGMDAPLAAKAAFTSALQIIGVIAFGVFLAGIGYLISGQKP
jgi:hypothetical protein